MKNMRYITICAALLLALACSKDKPETKPSIKIKSIGPDIVPIGGNLQVTLEFADKEGDINEDSLFVKKIRTNTIPPVSGITVRDSFWIVMPDFPAKATGEILLNLTYEDLKAASQAPSDPNNPDPDVRISDSLIFRFAIQDRAGNTSDTISSKEIVILRTR